MQDGVWITARVVHMWKKKKKNLPLFLGTKSISDYPPPQEYKDL